MWQVFWLIPVVDAFPSRNYLNSGVSSSTTQIAPNKIGTIGTYSCGYSSGF
jgi:hypothetical protein